MVGVDEIIGQLQETKKTKAERQGDVGRKKSYKMSVGCYQDPLGLKQNYSGTETCTVCDYFCLCVLEQN